MKLIIVTISLLMFNIASAKENIMTVKINPKPNKDYCDFEGDKYPEFDQIVMGFNCNKNI